MNDAQMYVYHKCMYVCILYIYNCLRQFSWVKISISYKCIMNTEKYRMEPQQ